MKQFKISDPVTNSTYSIMEVGDFEKVNPIQKMGEIFMNGSLFLDRQKFPSKSIFELSNNALQEWDIEYKKLISLPLSENLFSILENTSKKEQIKTLKGLSLTGEELSSFIMKAWERFGFKYSQYQSTHYHSGLDENKLPEVIHKENTGEIISIGETTLTQGQIKVALEQRTVKVAKFLDKENIWHCFFLTYKSLKGEEPGGQPHLHFISHTWGLTREYVLSQLQSKDYKLPSLPHISFHTHRNPRG